MDIEAFSQPILEAFFVFSVVTTMGYDDVLFLPQEGYIEVAVLHGGRKVLAVFCGKSKCPHGLAYALWHHLFDVVYMAQKRKQDADIDLLQSVDIAFRESDTAQHLREIITVLEKRTGKIPLLDAVEGDVAGEVGLDDLHTYLSNLTWVEEEAPPSDG